MHEHFKDGSFSAEIEDLLSWALEIHTKGLLWFKMLLSEVRIVSQIQIVVLQRIITAQMVNVAIGEILGLDGGIL